MKIKNNKITKINNIVLDKNQIKAVNTKRRRVLVLAGAGSGKTLVIAARIKYLLEVLKVNPKDILCISFTNDAVNKLKEDLNNSGIEVLTFHKLALKIIGKKKETLNEDILLDIIINTFSNDKLFGLYNIGKEDMFYLIKTFINLFKSKGYELDNFYDFLRKANTKEKELLKEIMKCYICYESYLNKENLIDFNDMINLAIKKINNFKIRYKYIIIDEYQDTSLTKFILINKLLKLSNASFFAVGDDFQSIYRFAGSDINIITNFRKYFFNAKIYKLKLSYRNPNELIKLAGKFIMKNPYQIRKKVHSNNYFKNPVEFVYYNDLQSKIDEIIKEDKIDNLFILARNNYTLDGIKVSKNVRKLTIHKSKGLQADFVFIIGLNNAYNGFPNKYSNHEILKFIDNHKDHYLYEEERRLFYVALTRCKKKVYLFIPKENQSIFVTELLKMNKKILIREE